MKFLTSVLLAIGLLIPASTAPTVSYNPKATAPFTVNFEAGADGACTVFRQLKEIEPGPNWPDGHYTPRHCWMFSASQVAYNDDWDFIIPEKTEWDVSAEVYYPNPDGSYRAVKSSNTVRVTW